MRLMRLKCLLPFRFRRRWPAVLALLALVSCGGNATKTQPQPETLVPDLPQQTLLTSSMRQQPVPGWTVTVDQLGLPPGTVARPVRNIGDLGVFLGITDEGWWLLGLDVTSGKRTFGPVRLGPSDGATDFNCFVNGPPMVLCVRQGADLNLPARAWVVDTSSGNVFFDGPTDLRVAGRHGQPVLEQLADYAIATVEGKGVYGVGSRGEVTWFVPGDGILTSQFTVRHLDTVPSTLAIQGGSGVADVVFSVVDGRVVKPAMPQGIQLGRAVAYQGGFGYEYTVAGDYTTERAVFFDDTGKKLSEPAVEGTLEHRSLDVPIVGSKSKDIVLTLDGGQLLQLPPSGPSPYARLIGSRFLVSTDAEHRVWQQYDLRTGEAGKTCEGESLWTYYIASDGEVIIALDEGDGLVQGVDLTTCDVLWSIPGSAPNEAKEVWKVHTTLVQRTDDKIFSLVAPK
jgi:hypothetical protein